MQRKATRLRDRLSFAVDRIARTATYSAILALGLLSPTVHSADAQEIILAASNTLIVRRDGGGRLGKRSDQISQMRATGQRVEIRGTCLSACTMYLSLPNACVTPTAILGFHGPSDYGRPLPQRDFDYWSQVMAANYREPLRSWYMATARYNIHGYYQLTGAQLIAMGYRAC